MGAGPFSLKLLDLSENVTPNDLKKIYLIFDKQARGQTEVSNGMHKGPVYDLSRFVIKGMAGVWC